MPAGRFLETAVAMWTRTLETGMMWTPRGAPSKNRTAHERSPS